MCPQALLAGSGVGWGRICFQASYQVEMPLLLPFALWFGLVQASTQHFHHDGLKSDSNLQLKEMSSVPSFHSEESYL